MAFSLPFKKKEIQKEHFFGLYFTHEHAVGFVFEIIDQKATILAKEMAKYSNGWENILEDVDKLISILESETDIHLDKSIFFVHAYMIDAETHALKNPYKDIIKNIAKQLDLKPLGYIEAHEAVKEYIEMRDDGPLNTVFTEIDSMHVGVYVYKGGSLILAEYLSRTSNIVEDVNELMNKVHSHTLLPSKMLIYGMIKIDDKVESLIQNEWNKELFIQKPRIELLKGEDLYAALGSIFAQQMGAETEEGEQADEAVIATDEEVVDEVEEVEEERDGHLPEAGAHPFGFVVGEDITLDKTAAIPTQLNSPKSKHISGNAKKIAIFTSIKGFFANFKLPNAFSATGKVGQKNRTTFRPLPASKLGLSIFALLGGFILLFFIFEYFFHTLDITVYLPAQAVEKQIDLTVNVSDSLDPLSLKKYTFSEEFTAEKATTGKRDVGEKAKGSVYISNFDNVEKSFAAGTKLESGGLTFTTDADVRVASASSVTAGGAKQSGRAKVTVTASSIGPESNLAQGKQLKIAGLSDALYVGVVESGLTGGSRKQVQTVSRKDLEDLEKIITEKAKNPSKEKSTSQIGSDEELIKTLSQTKTNEVEFSKEIGEETNQLDAKATVETTFYTFQKGLMQQKVAAELKQVTPTGFNLENKSTVYAVTSAKMNVASSAAIQIDAKGKAIKNFSNSSIQAKLPMTWQANIADVLDKEFDASGYKINSVQPGFFSAWTPFFQKNIKVSISSK